MENTKPRNYTLEWYYRNRERQIQKNREWKKNNRERMLAQKKKHYLDNREKILEKKKLWRKNNGDKLKEYRRRPEVKKRAREQVQLRRIRTNRAYDKQYYQKQKETNIEHLRERWCRYHRNNPRSGSRYSLEVQLAMNQVRLRDKNTCQWYGCGVNNRNAEIHVHHIFPRSERPDLELVQQYMICYCANHHALWHRYRGDNYSSLIKSTRNEEETEMIRGRD